MSSRVLIIGKIPPPIGGVTIHVQRLLQFLTKKKIRYFFLKLNLLNLLLFPIYLWNAKTIHLHSSSLLVQLYIVKLCNLFKKKSIITIHGNVYRYNIRQLNLVKIVIKKCKIPILLNKESFEFALKLNSNSKLISSFIPPVVDEGLRKKVVDDIASLKKVYLKVFCTSATGVTYDKNGLEIYGIIDLIFLFSKIQSLCLVICDPSNQYSIYCMRNNIFIPKNVYFISKPHSMFSVLRIVDGLIRNTSTDGDSIAIKESLYLNKFTFATNVVSRPTGTIIYERGKYEDLILKLESHNKSFDNLILDGSQEILNLYNN